MAKVGVAAGVDVAVAYGVPVDVADVATRLPSAVLTGRAGASAASG